MLVAACVVHGLEVVQVHHHDGRSVTIALRALQLVLAALQQRAPVEGLGQRVVGGQMLQLSAQAVGGHQHRANGQHEHGERIGADVQGLEQRWLHQVVARVPSQDGTQPDPQYQHVQAQHHLHQPYREVAPTMAQHEAQLRGVQHAHHHGEKTHPHRIVGPAVGQPGKHHRGARHHPVPGAPGGGLAHELPGAHVVGDRAKHHQLVGQHQTQPVRDGAARTKQHGGQQPQQWRRRPSAHAPDAGRVVPPHEQQHHGHDGRHEARQGDHGARVEVRHTAGRRRGRNALM